MALVYTAVLSNPGFETGTISDGWTLLYGNYDVGTTNPAPNSGSFYSEVNTTRGAFYQDYDVPLATVLSAGFESGYFAIKAGAFVTDYASDADAGQIFVHAINSDGYMTALWASSKYSGLNNVWYNYNTAEEIPVPGNTAKIRLGFAGVRASGSQLSAYTDDWYLEFYNSANSQYNVDVSPLNRDFSDGTSHWTVGTGTLATDSLQITAGSWISGIINEGYFSASAFGYAYQVVDITSTADIISKIDGGAAGIRYSYFHRSYEDNDLGLVGIRFLDSSDSVLGSTSHVASPFVADQWGQVYVQSITIPASTRKIQYDYWVTRSAGSNADGRVTGIGGTMTVLPSIPTTVTYPVSLSNNDFEANTTDGWLMDNPNWTMGTYTYPDSDAISLKEGNYYLHIGSFSSTAAYRCLFIHRTYDIPDTTPVKSGNLVAYMTYKAMTATSGSYRGYLIAKTRNGAVKGYNFDVLTAGTETEFSDHIVSTFRLPPECTNLEISVSNQKGAQSYNDFYLNVVSVFFVADSLYCRDVGPKDGTFTLNGANYWECSTVEANFFFASTLYMTDWFLQSPFRHLSHYIGTDSLASVKQTIALDDLTSASIADWIDTGSALFEYGFVQGCYNGNDQGDLQIRFLSGSLTSIKSFSYGGGSFLAPEVGSKFTGQTNISPLTRFIEYTHRQDKKSGTAANAWTTGIYGHLVTNSPLATQAASNVASSGYEYHMGDTYVASGALFGVDSWTEPYSDNITGPAIFRISVGGTPNSVGVGQLDVMNTGVDFHFNDDGPDVRSSQTYRTSRVIPSTSNRFEWLGDGPGPHIEPEGTGASAAPYVKVSINSWYAGYAEGGIFDGVWSADNQMSYFYSYWSNSADHKFAAVSERKGFYTNDALDPTNGTAEEQEFQVGESDVVFLTYATGGNDTLFNSYASAPPCFLDMRRRKAVFISRYWIADASVFYGDFISVSRSLAYGAVTSYGSFPAYSVAVTSWSEAESVRFQITSVNVAAAIGMSFSGTGIKFGDTVNYHIGFFRNKNTSAPQTLQCNSVLPEFLYFAPTHVYDFDNLFTGAESLNTNTVCYWGHGLWNKNNQSYFQGLYTANNQGASPVGAMYQAKDALYVMCSPDSLDILATWSVTEATSNVLKISISGSYSSVNSNIAGYFIMGAAIDAPAHFIGEDGQSVMLTNNEWGDDLLLSGAAAAGGGGPTGITYVRRDYWTDAFRDFPTQVNTIRDFPNV